MLARGRSRASGICGPKLELGTESQSERRAKGGPAVPPHGTPTLPGLRPASATRLLDN